MTVVKTSPAWDALIVRINAGLDQLAESEDRTIRMDAIPDLASATPRQRVIMIAAMRRIAGSAGWLLEEDYKGGEPVLRLV